ncbi:hypothetical protein [Flagellimonas sp. GZD32]
MRLLVFNSSKIAQLPNTYNVTYEELQSERQNPEARTSLGERKFAEWVA